MSEILRSDNEIDFKEFILSLWAHKIIITIITASFVVYSGFYSIGLPKIYTAKALFYLDEEGGNSRSNIPEGMDSIASFVGIAGNGGSKLEKLKERVNGRVFIQKISDDLNLHNDKYFNSYNPNADDPYWKSFIKNIIGFNSSQPDETEIIWNSIISAYQKSVSIAITSASNIEIIVNHESPERSAIIANIIMKEIIDNENNYKKDSDEYLYSFFSTKLAEAEVKLDDSYEKLKTFTLNRSSMPENAFAAISINLGNLKQKKQQTKELLVAVQKIEDIFESDDISRSSYLVLRKTHPIVDQVEFRRILGQNEMISDWNWPKRSTLRVVLQTLNERNNLLEKDIIKTKNKAEKISQDLEKFIELTREVKISEAVFSSMQQNIKTNELLNGMNKSKSEVYEYAVTPPYPSAPRRTLIILFGGLLGLFISVVIACVFSISKGVFYSNKSLLGIQKVNCTIRTKPFQRLSRKPIKTMHKFLISKNIAYLNDLKLAIHKAKKEFIIISGLGSKLKSQNISRLLGMSMQNDGEKVAFIDFSRSSKLRDNDNKFENINDNFLILENFENFYVITPTESLSVLNFIGRPGSEKLMKNLKSDFDKVILSSEGMNTLSLARFLSLKDVFHVVLSRKNKTKQKMLKSLCSILPMGAHMYD